MKDLWTCNLGLVDYRAAAARQEDLRARVAEGSLPDVMLLLEHPPVYSLGRRTQEAELGFGAEYWRARGIDVVRTRRGGKLTYHGPGQLVGYPIMRVGAVPEFVRAMESALVAALAEEGVSACGGYDEGLRYTGVWVGERKIASIGVHVSRGVSAHGFAINVDNDVEPFRSVIACGMPEVQMTSVALQTGRSDLLPCFRKRVAHQFATALGRRQRIVTPRRLAQTTRKLAPA